MSKYYLLLPLSTRSTLHAEGCINRSNLINYSNKTSKVILLTRWLAYLFVGVFVSMSTALAYKISSDGVVLNYSINPDYGIILNSVGDPQGPEVFELGETDLWEIVFRDQDQIEYTIKPSESNFIFYHTVPPLETPSQFIAIWRNVTSTKLGGESFNVMVEANAIQGDCVVEFNIKVITSTPSYSVYKVRFPRFDIISHGPPDNQILTWPVVGGWLLPNPISNYIINIPSPLLPPYPPSIHPGGFSMQWFAYYNISEAEPRPVLYTGTRDTTGHFKEYLFEGKQGGFPGSQEALIFTIEHLPENNLTPDGNYFSQFPAVLGVLRGDWYDAARVYRQWALAQDWKVTEKGRISDNIDFSEIMKNAKMIACMGLFEHDLQNHQYWAGYMNDIRSYFDVDIIPSHVRFWWNMDYNGKWGEWFPINQEFIDAAEQINLQGDTFAPYFVNTIYDSTIPSYLNPYVYPFPGEKVENYLILQDNGEYLKPHWSSDSYHICEDTPFMKDYTLYVADELCKDNGLVHATGIYLDCYTCIPPYPCYSTDLDHHNHSVVGGGDYQTQARIQYAEELRVLMEKYNDDPYIITEAFDEFNLGITELSYANNTGDSWTHGDPEFDNPDKIIAPLYQTVYHDYQIFGFIHQIHIQELLDPVLFPEFRRQYAANIFMGNAPWAGGQMGEFSFTEAMSYPHYEIFYEMIKNYMTVLKSGSVKNFVTFGERRRDPQTDATKVPLLCNSLGGHHVYGWDQPMVYTTVYTNPMYQGFGLLLLNWTKEGEIYPGGVVGGDKTVICHLDEFDDLPTGWYRGIQYDKNGSIDLGLFTKEQILDLSVLVPERSPVFQSYVLE